MPLDNAIGVPRPPAARRAAPSSRRPKYDRAPGARCFPNAPARTARHRRAVAGTPAARRGVMTHVAPASPRPCSPLALMAVAAGCAGPGEIRFNQDGCTIDGRAADLPHVEAREAAVQHRIASLQPWLVAITVAMVSLAGIGYVERLVMLFSARRDARRMGERLQASSIAIARTRSDISLSSAAASACCSGRRALHLLRRRQTLERAGARRAAVLPPGAADRR